MKSLESKITFLLAVSIIFFALCSLFQIKTAHTAALISDAPHIVVIDAGHGGEDGGAVSKSGVLESEINLAVAIKLEQLLALCGIETHMIRQEDISLHTNGTTIRERKRSDLMQRLSIIENTNNAILVSIHQNHFSESKYSGAQVFYSELEVSKQLASLTQQCLRNTLDVSNNRKCKPAESVYIMKKITCPGILIECGFLSNPKEEILLQNEKYQTKISCAVGSALAQYIEKGESGIEV